jgi:hypothetical protein
MKKFFSLIVLFFICFKSHAIIFWQPYPIHAAVTGAAMNQRIECSVYDSLLGSWQYYNTVYYNSNVDIEDSTSSIIVFHTYFSNPLDPDSIYGFIIYDQELHQFVPLISFEADVVNNIDASYSVGSFDEQVSISTSHYYTTLSDLYTNIDVYLYDILKHTWVLNGSASSDWFLSVYADIHIGYGALNVGYGVWHSHNHDGNIYFYGPANQDSISKFETYLADHGGNQDLYYFQYDGNNSTDLEFSAMDPEPTPLSLILTSDPGDFQCYGSILYLYDNTTASSYIAIYDDVLHHFSIDTIPFQLANIKVKDRVVAFTNTSASMLYYEAFSPSGRAWKKDSVALNLPGQISIQQGTVHWTDNGTSYIAGYNDTSGWGNFNTPLLLNFHTTDRSTASGYPLLFVRDYSIGTDDTWFEFADGITTLPGTQHSLWHLYKANGHYGNNFVSTINSTVCIHAGVQSYCESDSIEVCSVAGVAAIANDSICYGDSLTLSLSGYSGAIQWQKKNGTVWNNATGAGSDSSSFTFLPVANFSYRAVVTNGNCIPAYSNEVHSVVSYISPGYISTNIDTLCSGWSTEMTLLTYSGSIQWQYFDGNTWMNETGACSTCQVYSVTPSVTTAFRALVSAPGCTSDSSAAITLTVFPQLQDPVVVNDTVCNPDTVNLFASGGPYLCWYLFDQLIDTGSVLTRYITASTTFQVKSADVISGAGPPDTLFGSTAVYSGQYYGLQFDAAIPVTIEKVYVYPCNTTSLEVLLVNSSGVIYSKSFIIPTAYVKTPLNLGFNVPPGTGYLLLVNWSNLVGNDSNVSFPYSTSSGAVTITGSWMLSTLVDSAYLGLYDWVITEGCNSNLVPVYGIVYSRSVPTITLSNDTLYSTSASSYQWFMNGNLLPADTLNFFLVPGDGNYTVVTTDGLGCSSDTSDPFIITGIKNRNINHSIFIHPNPTSSLLTIDSKQYTIKTVYIYNVLGDLVLNPDLSDEGIYKIEVNVSSLPTGIYFLKIETEKGTSVQKFIKQ